MAKLPTSGTVDTDPMTAVINTKVDALTVKLAGVATAVDLANNRLVALAATVANGATVLAANTATLATHGAKLDALAVAVAKIGTGPVVVPPVDPPASDWPIVPQPAAGSTTTLSAGTKLGAMHIDNGNVTIAGAGMRKTIIDARGGVMSGAAMRLAWGKGTVHSDKPVTVRGIGFQGNYNTKGNSDGEAGVYNEGGIQIVQLCAFDSFENGVYSQARKALAGATAFTEIDRCVFGRLAANGLEDGFSHDVYLGGDGAKITGSIFAGTSRGNTIKLRANTLVLEDNWTGRTNGRFIDLPGGTNCNSRRNTYVTMPGAPSNNAFGFFDENDTVNTDGTGSFLSEDDTFIFGGRWQEVLWINRPSFRVEFIRPKVFWYGANPPAVAIVGVDMQGAGAIAGVNPFVFTTANRLDAPPVVPADPT